MNTVEVEVFQTSDAGNFHCGWCQAWMYSVPQVMEHAEQHLDMIKRQRAGSKLTITVAPKEEEESND